MASPWFIWNAKNGPVALWITLCVSGRYQWIARLPSLAAPPRLPGIIVFYLLFSVNCIVIPSQLADRSGTRLDPPRNVHKWQAHIQITPVVKPRGGAFWNKRSGGAADQARF